MKLDARTEQALVDMIRVSSNTAATAMMNEVGKDYIARVLLSPRYRLYDPKHNGGLWVGKDYGKAGLWKRDPLHNLSHGATAMQVARYFYMLQRGRLVTPEYSAKMKEILSNPGIYHKFVGALAQVNPAADLFRKSGSWRTYHSDSVIVERGRRAYIAVALSDSPEGKYWLKKIIVAFDGIIFGKSWLHQTAGRPD
jgi:beta-lactamase class A